MDTDKTPTNASKAPDNTPKTPKRALNTLILKNKKHELFAQEMINPDTKSPTEAYAKVYGVIDPHISATNAGKLLKNTDIRSRVLDLLDSHRSTKLDRLTERLGDHVESDKGELSLKAVELGFKLHGALDIDNLSQQDPADIQINIISNSNVVNKLDNNAT